MKKSHHAAHVADSSFCILNTPEGALHFNTKIYNAKQLEKGTKLFIEHCCEGSYYFITRGGRRIQKQYRDCSTARTVEWLKGWDEILVEKRLSDLKPDIVLMKNGLAIGAVEVFSKHSVDEIKSKKFSRARLPWIEVKARGGSYDLRFLENSEGSSAWTLDKPFPWEKIGPLLPAWQCADCEELDTVPPHERADYELRKTLGIFRREKEEQIKRKYGDRRNNRILFAQAIELRFRTGEEVLKEIFVMLRCDPATNERELYLRIGRDQLEPWMSEPCDDAYARERLNTRLRRWKEDLSEHCSIHTVTGWVDEETYFELMASRAS